MCLSAIQKGFCTLKFVFLITLFFHKFNFKYVQVYALKKQTLKKNPHKGCANPPNVPKLGVSSVKVNAKTNKGFGMLCYIQVKYSVFFRW